MKKRKSNNTNSSKKQESSKIIKIVQEKPYNKVLTFLKKVHNRFSKTLIYNVLTSFVIIILLLFILFKIAPHTARIESDGDLNSAHFATDFISGSITFRDFTKEEIEKDDKHIAFRIGNFPEKQVSPFLYDAIVVLENGDAVESLDGFLDGFEINGPIEYERDEKAEYLGEYRIDINKYFVITGEEDDKEPDETGTIDYYYNGESMNINLSPTKEIIEMIGAFSPPVYEGGGNLFCSADTIDLYFDKPFRCFCKNGIKYNGKAQGNTITFMPLKNKLGRLAFLDEACFQVMNPEKVELNNCHQIEGNITGDISFGYGVDPQTQKVKGQNLRMASKTGGIFLDITSGTDANIISAYGVVDKAYLADMDLFPTFRTWYRNNIYLVPITLASTIFSAIALILSARKENSDQKEQTIVIKVDSQSPITILEDKDNHT